MIIDKDGNMLSAFSLEYGEAIHDVRDGVEYYIALPYDNDESIKAKKRIRVLKQQLKDTDYKALKYADGALTDEEYEEDKKQRQAWRDEINECESKIVKPTLTPDEVKAAEDKAMQKIEELRKQREEQNKANEEAIANAVNSRIAQLASNALMNSSSS